jgi:peptide/nickel transport system ATP-binding protein
VDGSLNIHQSVLEKGRPPGEGKYPREEAGPTLLIEGVSVHFPERRSLLGELCMQPSPVVKAVNDVDLEVERGQVVGLVGESGSGKTTLANAISGLVARTEGDIRLLDETLPKGINQRSKDTLRAIQVVFQNPGEALNPYHSVGQALRRPLKRLREIPSDELEGAVAACLEAVNLPPEYAQSLPVQLSGGELQRLAIARAYAIFPEVLIADEPVSSLDVSVQASILNLFHNLQRVRSICLLFISHDLAVVGYLADKVVVIYKGQVMEVSPISSAFDPPHHPYTEVLLSSIPVIGHTGVRTGEQIEERMTSTSDDTKGCPFQTRCPRSLGNVCGEQVPPWWEDKVTGKRIFCHIPIDELRADQKRRSDLIVPIDQD